MVQPFIVGSVLSGKEGVDHVLPRLPPRLGQLAQLPQRPLQPGNQLRMVTGGQCQPFGFVHQHPLRDLVGAIPAENASAAFAGMVLFDLLCQGLQGRPRPWRLAVIRRVTVAPPRDGQALDHGPGLRAGPNDVGACDIDPASQDHQQHVDAQQHQPPAEVRHPTSPPHHFPPPRRHRQRRANSRMPGVPVAGMSSGRHGDVSW